MANGNNAFLLELLSRKKRVLLDHVRGKTDLRRIEFIMKGLTVQLITLIII